jgi:hypothetical protein
MAVSPFDVIGGTVAIELLRLACGKEIGDGVYRKVYLCRLDPTVVLKFEYEGGDFHNQREWIIWKEVEYSRLSKWFAPCQTISSCGSILVQKLTADLRPEDLPKKVPAFFTDLKMENFGMLDGRIVCRDYGFTRLMTVGMTSRMIKADWSEI